MFVAATVIFIAGALVGFIVAVSLVGAGVVVVTRGGKRLS